MKTIKIKKNDLDSKTLDATLIFKAAIETAKKSEDAVTIEFEKGEYHFYKENADREICYTSNTDAGLFPEKSIALNIKNVKNLNVNGNGSDFIMHGDMMAVAVRESENVTLENFSWDFPCASVLEMNVVETGKNYADFYIPEYFGIETKRNKLYWFEKSPLTGEKYWENVNLKDQWGIVGFDKENDTVSRYGLLQSPLWMMKKIEKKDNNIYRIYYKKSVPDIYREGMCFELCTNKLRPCTGGFLSESKNIRLSNISSHYMHGFGFLTQMSENVSFENCHFVPKENSDRVTTSFADLIHVSGAKGKISISDCEFSHAHDDPINIHGTFTRVKKKIDDNTIVLSYIHKQQKGFKQFHVGDKVVFYSRTDLQALENEQEFTVESVTDPSADSLSDMTVRFREKLPDCICDKVGFQGKYVAENVTYTPEVHISNCKFSHIPTRGILCTTRKKVVIENNTFDSMAMASIYLSNDSNNWYESGPIRDMTIQGNTFYIKRSPQREWKDKGAIFVDPIVKGKGTDKPIHHNITIRNNRFMMEHDNVVKAKNVKGLTFENNTVVKIKSKDADETIKAFVLTDCSEVNIGENSFDSDVDATF